MEEDTGKRHTDLANGIVELINQMRNIANGVYKHTYDIDMPLSSINKPVVASIEKILEVTKEEMLVSENLAGFIRDKNPVPTLALEYVVSEEERRQRLKRLAQGKSKYLRMFYNETQKDTRDGSGGCSF